MVSWNDLPFCFAISWQGGGQRGAHHPCPYPFRPWLRPSASPWNCPGALALYSHPDDPLLDELPSPAPVRVTSWTPALPRRSKTHSTMASTDMPLGVVIWPTFCLLPVPPHARPPPCFSSDATVSRTCWIGAVFTFWCFDQSAATEPCDPGAFSHACALAPLPLL